MDVHDPRQRDSPARPPSPLPHRSPATDLDARDPVPAPRRPADGPPVPAPAPAATTDPTGPTGSLAAVGPPRTPPMPWPAVGPAPVPPPVPAPDRPRRTVPEIVRDTLRRNGPQTVVERRAAWALAVTVVLVGSAAIVLGAVAGPPDGPATTAAPAAERQAGTADVADGAVVVDAAAYGTDVLTFRSPTGNIDCRLDAGTTRCTVATRSWGLPAGSGGCPAADVGAALSGTGPATPSCGASGAGSARPLDYDRALRQGDVTCVSRRDGVECRNAVSGHGFAVARADYRVY